MGRIKTVFRYLIRNRGSIWGIKYFRASYGFFIGYLLIIAGGIAKEPWLIAIGLGWSLLIELSNILPKSRRRVRLTSWHSGLEIRSWWRIVLAAAALAIADAPTVWVAATAIGGFGYQLISKFIRSSLFYLDSGKRIRPIGSLTEGRELLQAARDVGHRRNRVQIPLQVAFLGSMVFLAAAAHYDWATAPVVGALGAAAAIGGVIVLRRMLAVRQVRKALFGGFDEAVIAAFRDSDPEVLCYFNGEPRSMFVLNIWLNVFAASRHRIGVVLRHPDTWRLASESIPGVVVRSAVRLEQLPTPSTSVVLYPANGMHNAHMMRDVTLSHVFLGHGDSDKASSVRPINRTYDKLWVAGQAAVDRYRAAGFALPDDRFDLIGRPLLSKRVRDLARDASNPESPYARLMAALDEVDLDERPLTIVYAPTTEGYFEDSNYTSLATMGPAMIATILEEFGGARVIFKPHPMSGHRLAEMRQAGAEIREMLTSDPRQFHPSVTAYRVDLFDWLDLADILITDVSSVATDWLAWDKPLIVTNPKRLPPAEFAESFPVTRAAYVLDESGEQVAQLLDQAFGDDPMQGGRRDLRKHYLGDPSIDPMDAFDAALDDLIAAPPSRVVYSRQHVAVPATDMGVQGTADEDPEDVG